MRSLGDLDGDGKADFAIPRTVFTTDDTHIQLRVFYGRLRALSCDSFSVPGCIARQEIGADLAVGDLTGDQRADILVSAPTDQSVAPDPDVARSSLARSYLVSPPARTKP